MIKFTLFAITFCMTTALGARAVAQDPADLVVTNARIYTVDETRPMARAMAISEGHIVYVGNERGAATFVGPHTRRLDAHGQTIIPGMVDAHVHLMGFGAALRIVDLVGTESYEAVIQRVAERAQSTPAGEWIRGRGWDQNDWPVQSFPTEQALSRAIPDHPVYLTRVDGHAVLVNARALELAGVTAATPDPPGGRIIRDDQGNPTGVLVDRAQGLVGRVIPPTSRREREQGLYAAMAELNRWGLTGVHDAGADQDDIDLYESVAQAGHYTLRNYVMITPDQRTLDRAFQRGPQSGLYGGHLWFRAIKMYADGALGSRGAALLEDYSDEPGNRGLIRDSLSQIESMAEQALRRGFQVNVHAIGDRGVRMTLDAFEAALDAVPTPDHRFRVEHAQNVTHEDIPRFAELGVIPSMQGSHQTSDMYWAETRLGPSRIWEAYPWRALLNTGVIIPNGSDLPVEFPNPLISFHAFFTRQDANRWPPGGWHPEERTTREEALKSITLWPAFAGFMEHVTGTLSPGKYADFVVLDQDIMSVAPERVLDTNVVMTVIGGEVVYERDPT